MRHSRQRAKGGVGHLHSEVIIKDNDRDLNRFDDQLSKVASFTDRLLTAPDLVDIDEHEDQSVYLVFRRPVRPNSHQMPAPSSVLHFDFPGSEGFQHLLQDRFNVIDHQIEPDFADSPAQIGSSYMHDAFGRGSEAPN